MAEALAFVSLAGNVLQFLQFAGSIVSHARQAYRSVDGSPKSYQEMVLVAKDLEKCTTSFEDTTDPATKSLIDECKAISLELRTVLDKIPKPKGPGHKMTSVKSALVSKWYEPNIDQAEKRLENLRNELILCIQTFLKRDILRLLESSDSNGKKIDLVIQTQDESLSQIVGSLDAARDAILDRCNGINMVPGELVTEFRDVRKLLEDLIKLQAKAPTGASPGGSSEAPSIEDFLDTLKFRFQDDREDSIAEPSEDTFEWILMDPDDVVPDADGLTYAQQRRGLRESISKDFERYYVEQKHVISELEIGQSNAGILEKFKVWLRGGKGIFWIFGKPGSGKSTFMKAMVQNPVMRARLDEMLTSASPDGDYILASFYFFRAGSVTLQKSKEGMLRSLLHQILQQRPQHVNAVFSISEQLQAIQRAAAPSEDGIVWSVNELRRAFKTLRRLDDSLLYLHIDGIDEIEGQPREIANLLNELATYPKVKILTAGRHYAAFNHGLPLDQRMNLNDYTALDIAYVVLQRLHDPLMQDIVLSPEHLAHLTHAMISAAQGVFLWVAIVSESILDGASQFESFEQLLGRIEEYPADLDELYESILQSINPRYLAEASFWIQFVFKGATWATDHQWVHAMEHINTEDILRAQNMDFEDCRTIIHAKGLNITPKELNMTERRIQTQCPHIFDMRTTMCDGTIITFSHRTFLDFLAQNDNEKIKELSTNIWPSKSVELCYIASRLLMNRKMPRFDSFGAMIWRLLDTKQYASARKIWACVVHFLRDETDSSCTVLQPTLSGWIRQSSLDLVRPGDLAMALMAQDGHKYSEERDLIIWRDFLAKAQLKTTEVETVLLPESADGLTLKVATYGSMGAGEVVPLRFARQLGQTVPEVLPRNSLCAMRILEVARIVSEGYFQLDKWRMKIWSPRLDETGALPGRAVEFLERALLLSTTLIECFCEFVEIGVDPNMLAVYAHAGGRADQISVLTLIRDVNERFTESKGQMRQYWKKGAHNTEERLSSFTKSIESLGGLELHEDCSVSSLDPDSVKALKRLRRSVHSGLQRHL